MLRTTHHLQFPRLNFVGNVDMRQWKDTNKVADCYKLDWSGKEEKVAKGLEEWVGKTGVSFDTTTTLCVPDFPVEYDEWLKDLTFVVSRAYVEEIRRNARRCVEEWNVPRPFDTIARELCLAPAIKHAYTAFYLVSDCAYDQEEKFYYRGDRKALIPHMMAYKFWTFQTGSGVVECNSDIGRLAKLLNKPTIGAGEKREIESFLEAIEAHQHQVDKFYEKMRPQGKIPIEE